MSLISNIVLATKQINGHWEALRLSSYHNGTDQSEKERIMEEHPGETECIVDDRVLGAIAVTRGKPASIFWSMNQANCFCLPL